MTTATIQERLGDPDGEVRRIALLDLQYSDEDDFVGLAVSALGDHDPRVRAEAARILEGYEEDAAVAGLAG